MPLLLLSTILVLANPALPSARQGASHSEPCYWSITELAPHPERPDQWRVVRSHQASRWRQVVMVVNAIKYGGGASRVEKICGWSPLIGI